MVTFLENPPCTKNFVHVLHSVLTVSWQDGRSLPHFAHLGRTSGAVWCRHWDLGGSWHRGWPTGSSCLAPVTWQEAGCAVACRVLSQLPVSTNSLITCCGVGGHCTLAMSVEPELSLWVPCPSFSSGLSGGIKNPPAFVLINWKP